MLLGDQTIVLQDLRDRARRRVLAQFKDSPRLQALVYALASGVQTVEESNLDVLSSTGLAEASGHDLDHWGLLVGEKRGALSDQPYRRFIRARMIANLATGSADDMVRVAAAAAEPCVVLLEELDPATVVLHIYHDAAFLPATRNRVRDMVRFVKPAGVALRLVEVVGAGFAFQERAGAEAFNVGLWARTIT